MVFRVQITPPTLPPNLRRRIPRRVFEREMKGAANKGAILTARIMAKISPVALGLLRQSWLAGITPARIFGRSAVAFVSSQGLVALVWDLGTIRRNPFPPVGGTGTPALGAWIRRKLAGNAFVVESDGTERPADLGDPEDVRKIAFKIGAAIRSRGLPNPTNPRDRAKGLYTRAFRFILPELRRFQDEMITRLVLRFQER